MPVEDEQRSGADVNLENELCDKGIILRRGTSTECDELHDTNLMVMFMAEQ